MPDLITVPCFIFNQGDPIDTGEMPIHVLYFNGGIEIRQGDDTVYINPDYLNKLFTEIKRHLPEAERVLDNR